jgi:hypothetical protein
LPPDEPCPLQGYQHLVNRRWADPKILPQVGFRWRPAVQAREFGGSAQRGASPRSRP